MKHEIDDSQIEELRKICEQIYGTEITTGTAGQMAFRLYELYNILTQMTQHSDVDWEHLATGLDLPDQS